MKNTKEYIYSLKRRLISFKNHMSAVGFIPYSSGRAKEDRIIEISAFPDSSSETEGKTALFNRIAAAVYENRDLLTYSNKDWLNLRGKNISMIFQDSGNMLNQILPIGRQFTEYLRVHDNLTEQEAYFFATEMLTRMNLPNPDNIMKSYPFELSGGMRQRVGIAMAMIFRPELLLADEPTSALDVTTQAQIVKELMSIPKSCGTAMIIVTHNIGVAAYMSDKIMVMSQGKAVEYGKTSDIINSPQAEYTKALLSSVPQIGGKRYV